MLVFSIGFRFIPATLNLINSNALEKLQFEPTGRVYLKIFVISLICRPEIEESAVFMFSHSL